MSDSRVKTFGDPARREGRWEKSAAALKDKVSVKSEKRHCNKLAKYAAVCHCVAGTRGSEMRDKMACSGLEERTGFCRVCSKEAARARATCSTRHTPYLEWVHSPFYYYHIIMHSTQGGPIQWPGRLRSGPWALLHEIEGSNSIWGKDVSFWSVCVVSSCAGREALRRADHWSREFYLMS